MLLFKFIKNKSSFILSFGELALIAPHATPTRARKIFGIKQERAIGFKYYVPQLIV
jgi:hypothetical protein